MKRLLAIIMSVLNVFCSANAQDGLSLTSLWREYEDAASSDKPQRQITVLREIKSEALKEKLPADYYHAGELFRDVQCSRNWKLRDSLYKAFSSEMENCGMSVAEFYYRRQYGDSDLFGFIRKNEQSLAEGSNRYFWDNDPCFHSYGIGNVGDFLRDKVENDYEYALWSLACSHKDKQAVGELSSRLSYPKNAILDFLSTQSPEELASFRKKYSGKAAELMAWGRILTSRFDSLSLAKASSEEFRKLRQECRHYESIRHSFTGEEGKLARCLTEVESLCCNLDGEDLSGSIDDGTLTILLKNLGSVRVDISKDGEKAKIWSGTFENKGKSFYVEDSLRIVLPAVDDGDYDVTLSSGKIKKEINWSRYSISLAQRWDLDGLCIFAADYLSGEPVRKADIYCAPLSEKAMAPVKDFCFNGFTRLPSSICGRLSSSRMYGIYCQYVDASGHLRRSRTEEYYPDSTRNIQEPEKTISGMILPDCCAFNPGQTLHFKAILFEGNAYQGYETLCEGESASVSIMDPDNKKIFVQEGTTDAFGGISGLFRFPEDCKGGLYRMVLRHGRNTIVTSMVRVDEFVLPSYELQFQTIEGFHFPGDSVKVKGVLKSYSGHTVSSAHLSYETSGAFREEGDIAADKDGNFTISLKIADDISGYHNYESIKVKIIDNSGEVLEFHTSFNISGRIDLRATLCNAAEGQVSEIDEGEYISRQILPDGKAEFSLRLNSGTNICNSDVEYRITGSDGKEIQPWKKLPSLSFEEDFSSFPCGLYFLEARVRATSQNGRLYENDTRLALLKTPKEDSPVNFHIENFFKVLPGESIGLQIGTGSGKMWACVELFGQGGKLLKSQLLTLNNQTMDISWDYQPQFSESVALHVLYFKNGRQYSYYRTYRRSEIISHDLPFSVEKFTDRALPSSEVRMSFKTSPDAQCTATVFDKSTESVMANTWDSPVYYGMISGPEIYYDCACGESSGGHRYLRYYGRNVLSKSGETMVMMADAAPEMAVANTRIEDEEEATELSDVNIREKFETALCFEPSLTPESNGVISLAFKTSDKLSTYLVQLFAHDRNMNYSSMRKEMLVTIPLKVSVREPAFLYEGDHYAMKATVSSNYDADIKGKLVLDGYGSFDCIVPAGGSVTKAFEINVGSTSESLDFLLGFKSDIYSDAIRFSVPVLPAEQVLTEAYSMIIHPGDNIEDVKAELISHFECGSGYGAQYCEKSILKMVRDALPELTTPESDNIISLSSALYSSLLSSRLGKRQDTDNNLIIKKMLDCVCSDGGLGWYAGMKASPIITATVLERIAAMKNLGILPEQLEGITEKAVRYLDNEFFSQKTRPLWCGWISMEQYMSVRAKFSYIPFLVTPDASWKKNARNYLVPKRERGLNGAILSKARRLETLGNLSLEPSGRELAKACGITTFTQKRLSKSIEADLASLLEYAVPHKSGGMYFPNAVMPYRGLLESELYAHSFLCNLFQSFSSTDTRCPQVADGIRLWIMIQKETQQWESDPAYIDAIASVLEGSDYVLGTKVATMTKSFLSKLPEIKPFGNGMKIECSYFVDEKAVSDGDTLRAGDKIEARYKIWNEENRSFVRLDIPHPASFTAVNQLSGPYGWWMKPVIVDGLYSIVPQGYREVREDRTVLSFDSYPEETTTVTEHFYVTQEGVFQAAAPTVECLYSPHYRAGGTAICRMNSMSPLP